MNNKIVWQDKITLDSNPQKPQKKESVSFEIMHMEKVVARFVTNGKSEILLEKFMPYDLWLDTDDENDIDILMNNVNNFYHWCASRVLSLDRKYAKEIMNSIGVIYMIIH